MEMYPHFTVIDWDTITRNYDILGTILQYSKHLWTVDCNTRYPNFQKNLLFHNFYARTEK